METPPRTLVARPTRRTRPRVGDLMALIAGLALALWLYIDVLRQQWGVAPAEGSIELNAPFIGRWDSAVWTTLVVVLGGVSFVGVPMLLRRRWRVPRAPWGPGSQLWFAQGVASWLLWPPAIIRRTSARDLNDTMSAICYFYGTPVMAVAVAATLLAGGQFRRGRWRRLRLSWHERFGLLVGLVWACTGLYLLAMYWRNDLSR